MINTIYEDDQAHPEWFTDEDTPDWADEKASKIAAQVWDGNMDGPLNADPIAQALRDERERAAKIAEHCAKFGFEDEIAKRIRGEQDA